MSEPQELTWRDRALAAVLGGGYVAWLLATVKGLGYARDEGFYIVAGNAYARWFRLLVDEPMRAVSRAAVDSHWTVNHEHPPLMKGLFGLSHLLDQELDLFAEPGTAYRFPAMLMAGGLVALLFLWGTRVAGRAAGLVAALAFALMPRVFFHAHLACFDLPITTLFVACCYAFCRAQESEGAGWGVTLAGLFGLALATKHNAWILPLLFACHVVASAVGARIGRASALAAGQRGFAALMVALMIGPAIAWALWPWLWRDTFQRVAEYVAFHVHHEFYNMEFLGRSYHEPPFPRAYAPLMTAATVPTTTLLLAALGLIVRGRATTAALRRRDAWAFGQQRDVVLWLGAILASYGPWVSSGTPIFGGTKHWMTAYPFLALFAGVGFARVLEAVRDAWPALAHRATRALPAALVAGLAIVVMAPAALTTARSHPWGLSAYVPLVGGAPGAATLGLNRTFWGYTTGSAAPWLDAHALPEARVYAHDTLNASWDQMVRDGSLRKDLVRVGSVADADLALYHQELHMQGQEAQAWVAFETVRPALVLGPDGVPVVMVYRTTRGRVRTVGDE